MPSTFGFLSTPILWVIMGLLPLLLVWWLPISPLLPARFDEQLVTLQTALVPLLLNFNVGVS